MEEFYKKCSQCGWTGLCSIDPTRSEFNRNASSKDGFRQPCKACRKKTYDPEARRIRYETNREHELKLKRARYVRRTGKRGRKKQENQTG